MKTGSLLSAIALLAIYAYQTAYQSVQQNGGNYPPAIIIVVSLFLLPVGSALSYHGARLLHTRLGLVVPLAGVAILTIFFIQWAWCYNYCFAP